MPATERVPVLMTLIEKKTVVAKAKKAGMKTGEFMRLAARNFEPDENEKALESLIDQMNSATSSASRSIDQALDFVSKSNKRIEKMTKATKK